MTSEVLVGAIKIVYIGAVEIKATPIRGGDPIAAIQHLSFVTGPDGIALETAYLIFSNGDRDVRVIETGDTPSPYSRLGHGGRLGVYPLGKMHYCETRAMKLGDKNWSNLHRTTAREIEGWLGSNLNGFLFSLGLSKVITREELFGDEGRRRHELATSFESTNFMAPFAIFALTRPLPLLKGARR